MFLIACALAVGSPLAPIVFGREFDAVGPALVLLLPGMVAYGVWQLLASHLLRIGRRGFLAATAWLFGLASIGLQAIGAQLFGLPGAAIGLSLAYVLATVVVLVAFVRMSGQPARDLLPVPGDLAFYVGLTRRVLATR
jgi:O-antigen/teichoic acid export membrane protein